MKERPILFSAPMVRAILDGRKTMTRRVVKGIALDWLGRSAFTPEYVALPANGLCPFGVPGDRLWVREAWRVPVSLDDLSGRQIAEKCLDAGYQRPWCPTQYEADGARTSEKDWREFGPHPSTSIPGRYRHARFMPRWASRITLEITGVRVERLQDISEADAIAEGVQQCEGGAMDYLSNDYAQGYSPVASFRSLWESINGAGSWDANPWVWVVEFKRMEIAP